MDQLALPLLEPPPADPTPRRALPVDLVAVQRVERALRDHLGPKVVVKMTHNHSTMISFRERRGVTYLRLHTMFQDAPDGLLALVAAFVSGAPLSREASAQLDAWIEAHRPPRPSRAPRQARPYGEVHDLEKIYEQLNRRWFDGSIQARITWGDARPTPNKRRTSIQLGAYDEQAQEIRIHPVLDQTWVPAYFVASVVFHEMLHEKHDAPLKNGRRQIHSPAFVAEERKFPDYRRAQEWQARHLDRLLGY